MTLRPLRDAFPERTTHLPPVESVDSLDHDVLPGFLAHLAALQGRAAARLAIERVAVRRQAPHPEQQLGEPDLVPVGAAARVLAISITALRRLERRGEIPSVRVGRRLLFRRATLERFASEREMARN